MIQCCKHLSVAVLFLLALLTASAQDDSTTQPPASGTGQAPVAGSDAAPAAGSEQDVNNPVPAPHRPAMLPPSTLPKPFHKAESPSTDKPDTVPLQEEAEAPAKEKKKLKIDWSKMGDFVDGLIGIVISAGVIAVIAIPAAIVAVTQFK